MSINMDGFDGPPQQQQQPPLQLQPQPHTIPAATALPNHAAASSLQQQHQQQQQQQHYQQQQQHQQRPEPSCMWLIRAVKWIPVLFIMSIIGWSYYAYVVQLCIMSVATLTEQILFLFFYHIVFALFFWSYWQTVFTNVGGVPAKFRLPRNDLQKLARAESAEQHKHILEQFARDLPISNRTYNGSVRFCDKCLLVKPDRAHHCSVCGQCVLKMDHHCPWVNNCVNFTNYKYFVLFLGYALVYCLYVALTSLRYFVLFWEGTLTGGMGRFHILFLFFVAVMFAVSLVSLFGYHLYLVTLNRTTLEAFRAPVFRVGGPDKNGFHLGYYNNLQEVFGDDRKRWLLPVFSSLGDGCGYPLAEHQRNVSLSYDSMGATTASASSQPGSDNRLASSSSPTDGGV